MKLLKEIYDSYQQYPALKFRKLRRLNYHKKNDLYHTRIDKKKPEIVKE